MKKPVLVLLALLSLIPVAQSGAQTPAAAASASNRAANPAASPAPDSVARFLATLSGGQTQTPNDLAPAPSFMTGCTSNDQCPTGEICCFLCGNPPADPEDYGNCRGCVPPVKGGYCPQVY
jgi:hypothetical protein